MRKISFFEGNSKNQPVMKRSYEPKAFFFNSRSILILKRSVIKTVIEYLVDVQYGKNHQQIILPSGYEIQIQLIDFLSG